MAIASPQNRNMQQSSGRNRAENALITRNYEQKEQVRRILQHESHIAAVLGVLG